MKITYEELQQLEELVREGTPLDEAVMEEARAACGGLKFIQTGPWVDNVVFAQPSGGVGIMVSVAIQNVSNRVIPLKEARLEMPWPDADFQWLKKPSSKEVREWGGYFLAASGPCRFDPSEVLNHRFGRDSKLYPREFLEGLLLGEGPMSVPDEYADRQAVPVRLIVFAGRVGSYGSWLKLGVRREGRGRNIEPIDQLAQPADAQLLMGRRNEFSAWPKKKKPQD